MAAINEKDKGAAAEILRRSKGDDEKLIRMGWGDLEKFVEIGRVCRAAQEPVQVDAILAHLKRMKRELEGSHPSPLERLLVGRICACWLDLQDRERFALPGQKDLSVRLIEHRGRMRDRAHARYLSAIKALAQLRKLAIPNVVVVTSAGGPQQVNLEPPPVVLNAITTRPEPPPAAQ